MAKKKRAPVRNRRTPRRPTRRPVRSAKRGEGRRAFRYFVPKPTKKKKEAGSGIHRGAGRSCVDPARVVPALSASFDYFEPPPPEEPFVTWPNDRVLAWLREQDAMYQQVAHELAAAAGFPVAVNERRRAGARCGECGRLDRPNALHKRFCSLSGYGPKKPLIYPFGQFDQPLDRMPKALANIDDDDLPF